MVGPHSGAQVLKLPEIKRKRALEAEDSIEAIHSPQYVAQYQAELRQIEGVVEGGPLYTAGKLGHRQTCVVKVSNIDRIFGDPADGFFSKQAAKRNAAASLLGYLHGQEEAGAWAPGRPAESQD
ncbi:hypothetical protein MMC22_010191 [Lobaria immixta]|nr:hypothetical protein [Lobaria immixta]